MTVVELRERVNAHREKFPGYQNRSTTLQLLAVQYILADVLRDVAGNDINRSTTRGLAEEALRLLE